MSTPDPTVYNYPIIPLVGAHRGQDYDATEREYEGTDE